MLFDQDRLDAIIHNWKNQVFGNKTIHGAPRSAFDVFEAAYRQVPEPGVKFRVCVCVCACVRAVGLNHMEMRLEATALCSATSLMLAGKQPLCVRAPRP